MTRGAARMIDQRALTGELLASEIVALARNGAERAAMSAAARRLAKPDAAQVIVDRVWSWRAMTDDACSAQHYAPRSTSSASAASA